MDAWLPSIKALCLAGCWGLLSHGIAIAQTLNPDLQPAPVIVSTEENEADSVESNPQAGLQAMQPPAEAPLAPRVATNLKLQPAPALPAPESITPDSQPATPTNTSALRGIETKSLLTQGNRRTGQGPAAEAVGGAEALPRGATDVGSLLGRSPSIIGVGVQRRNPIINDPRIRGNRIGELAASGSHWIPARIDLDTAVSKLDSSMVGQVNLIRGPYSVQNGPGRSFIDIELARSPRYQNGWETHAVSGLEYKTNGEQFTAKELLFGGDEKSGYRAGYVHRTGNDYIAGNGQSIPASYNSREFDIALGRDWGDDDYFEFNYLRLDQTGVELPGQAFDIDYLATNGFSIEYGRRNGYFCDNSKIEFWYNDTQFAGNAQQAGKRQLLPVFDLLNYTGNTDVNSASIGYTAAISWGDPEETELTLGNDLRVVTQALNEFGSGRIGANIFQNANSPIPKSQSIDPGIFLAAQSQVRERLKIRAGLRADWIHTEILENPANLQTLGNYTNIFPIAVFNSQPTFAEIVGTENWNQSFSLVSGYLSAEHTLNEEWTMLSGAGVGRRPPSLTELYAAQPFMFLLQNGLNTVTGDPLLQDETFTQLDIGLQYQSEKWNGGVNAFHTWANNNITFENLSTDANQVNLKYVNTDLATFAGCEGFMQYQATEFMTPFMTISYVDGRDRTRNGNFATRQVNPQALVVSSFRDPTQVRGAFSGIAGGSEEALPGITPFESRLGLRFQTPQEAGQLGAEISARIVASQTRVATSLLEQTTSGFTLWDMRLYYRPRSKALFYGGIENLTDITYREHLDFRNRNNITGIFQPGANFSFGAQLDF